MGSDLAEVEEPLPNPCPFKVHSSLCTELWIFVDRISRMFPEIEAARPRCSSGIQALFALNRAIDKAKQLFQDCSDSSKLYLAMIGDVTVSRCQKSRNLLEQSLGQIQAMVPVMLAVEISYIMVDLRRAMFMLDSSEAEAGKAVRGLLQDGASASHSIETLEVKGLKLAASKLHITSHKAILIERRSIKKLLNNVSDRNPTKKKILTYLMYLLKKYEKLIVGEQSGNDCVQHEGAFSYDSSRNSCIYSESVEVELRIGCGHLEAQNDVFSRAIPPEEFKCPISSRLMYDPVVIASGETFERMWIQKWFKEGHDTSPKTNMKLAHLSLTPNMAVKDFISKWCTRCGVTITDPSMRLEVEDRGTGSNSIDSVGSSLINISFRIDLSSLSLGSLDDSYTSDSSHNEIADGLGMMSMQTKDNLKCQSHAIVHETDLEFLSKLTEHPWESQCKVVEDVKKHLDYNEEACHSMSFENFFEPLVKFLRVASDLHDVKAQKAGSQLLLAFLSKNRSGISYLGEEEFSLLETFINTEITEEALDIMEVLSGNRNCSAKIAASGALTSILKILDSQSRDFQERAIKILYNLSLNSDICSHIVSLECIPKLVPFFIDSTLTGNCVSILKNLCSTEEARISVADTNGCIASVAELLETGSHETKENAVGVLLSLCSQRVQYCQLVMVEGVIPALVDISINGNDKGRVSASELLRLLRDNNNSDERECSGSNLDACGDSTCHTKERKSSKASGFFGRMSMFSKPSSLATNKKK